MASEPDKELSRPVASWREMKWSPLEKAIARKAFNSALQREFATVIQEVKNRAARLEEPSELWELEAFLARSRKKINDGYDYRYSMLPLIFANLIIEGRLSLEALHGLGEDKLSYIRRVLSYSDDWVARFKERESEAPSP
jgi:hypothetical protein